MRALSGAALGLIRRSNLLFAATPSTTLTAAAVSITLAGSARNGYSIEALLLAAHHFVYTHDTMPTGLILFAHGARDARWREPFERLLRQVQARHDGPVALAFLELMTPDLVTAARALDALGTTSAVIVPVFLGTGGHLRKDLPALVSAAQEASGVQLQVVQPVGEDDGVLEAIAAYCLRAMVQAAPLMPPQGR
jgi:sirohydrochlorin cobaltochelatase